jgi:hypothetical protein
MYQCGLSYGLILPKLMYNTADPLGSQVITMSSMSR